MRYLSLFISCIFLLTISCKNDDKQYVAINNEDFIKHLMLNNELNRVKIQGIDTLAILKLSNNGLTYLMNSHCSLCVAQGISLLYKYNRVQEDDKITLVVTENDSLIIDYHLEKRPRLAGRYMIVKNKYPYFVEGKLDDYNGILIEKKDGKITTYKFLYDD